MPYLTVQNLAPALPGCRALGSGADCPGIIWEHGILIVEDVHACICVLSCSLAVLKRKKTGC